MIRANCTVDALAQVLGSRERAERIAGLAGKRRGRRIGIQKMIEAAKLDGALFHKVMMKRRTLLRFCREHLRGTFVVRMRGHAFTVAGGIPHGLVPLRWGVLVTNAWEYLGERVPFDCINIESNLQTGKGRD